MRPALPAGVRARAHAAADRGLVRLVRSSPRDPRGDGGSISRRRRGAGILPRVIDSPPPKHAIFALSDDLVEAFAAHDPAQATLIGIPGHDHAWGDYSPAGAAAWDAVLAAFEQRLSALPPAPDRFARLAVRIMDDYLRDQRQAFAHGDHLRDLNSIESPLQHIRQVFTVIKTAGAADAENLITRLETVDQAFRGYLASLDEGVRAGLAVAKRQVLSAIEQARRMAGPSSLLLDLRAAFAEAGVLDAALGARLDAAVAHARSAFAAAADWLEAVYLPQASAVDAVGRERYVRAASRFLGAAIDPIETYAWGAREVLAIESEMASVAAIILEGASLREVIDLLKTDPARRAKDGSDFVRIIAERQRAALTDLDGVHFDIPDPIRRIDVKLAPPGGALGGYYVPPSEDFSRPGAIWYSVGAASTFALYDEISTAYHEGFPGHHLQCSLQVLLADRLSRLHRLLVFYPGHGEGWALYAEELMRELGYYERPEYVLGMLSAKLMRACRVVVDIGLHLGLRIPPELAFHPGETWNYDLVVEFVHRRAFLELDYAQSEATRYAGWPGQAISYKVGERVILELRRALESRLGGAFDRRAFHAQIIGSGSVGLDLLREMVLGESSGAQARAG